MQRTISWKSGFLKAPTSRLASLTRVVSSVVALSAAIGSTFASGIDVSGSCVSASSDRDRNGDVGRSLEKRFEREGEAFGPGSRCRTAGDDVDRRGSTSKSPGEMAAIVSNCLLGRAVLDLIDMTEVGSTDRVRTRMSVRASESGGAASLRGLPSRIADAGCRKGLRDHRGRRGGWSGRPRTGTNDMARIEAVARFAAPCRSSRSSVGSPRWPARGRVFLPDTTRLLVRHRPDGVVARSLGSSPTPPGCTLRMLSFVARRAVPRL